MAGRRDERPNARVTTHDLLHPREFRSGVQRFGRLPIVIGGLERGTWPDEVLREDRAGLSIPVDPMLYVESEEAQQHCRIESTPQPDLGRIARVGAKAEAERFRSAGRNGRQFGDEALPRGVDEL